jgi:hypothetical protein
MTEHLAIDAVTEIMDGLDENKMFVAAGPVSRILQTDDLQVMALQQVNRDLARSGDWIKSLQSRQLSKVCLERSRRDTKWTLNH